jgi:hypothetical protein
MQKYLKGLYFGRRLYFRRPPYDIASLEKILLIVNSFKEEAKSDN